MNDNQLPSDFWQNNVSRSHGIDNMPGDIWDRICKIRNSPIRLVKDVIIGEPHKPHTVLPEGLKGYLIDYPEAFYLTEEDYEKIEIYSFYNRIPATILGYGELVFLTDDDYEIIPPFFDMALADLACNNITSD